MRITNHMMARNVLRNIGKQTDQIIRLQEQIATRKKINRASDDPVGMAQILSYRKTIAAMDQYSQNIADAKMHIKTVESVLDSADEILQQVKGFISNPDPDLNNTFAGQISGLKDQLLGLANNKNNGVYLFAGEKTDTQPFDASGVYYGSGGPKEYLIGDNSVRISVATEGDLIFGASPNSVFNMLEDLETAMAAGDRDAIQAQFAPACEAIENIKMARAVNAGRYKLLESTDNRYQNYKVQMQKMLSSVEEADPVESLVELKVLQTSYESNLAVSAKVIQTSLINYLS